MPSADILALEQKLANNVAELEWRLGVREIANAEASLRTKLAELERRQHGGCQGNADQHADQHTDRDDQPQPQLHDAGDEDADQRYAWSGDDEEEGGSVDNVVDEERQRSWRDGTPTANADRPAYPYVRAYVDGLASAFGFNSCRESDSRPLRWNQLAKHVEEAGIYRLPPAVQFEFDRRKRGRRPDIPMQMDQPTQLSEEQFFRDVPMQLRHFRARIATSRHAAAPAADRAADHAADHAADRAADRATDRAGDRADDAPVQLRHFRAHIATSRPAAARAAGPAADRAADRAADGADDRAGDRAGDRADDCPIPDAERCTTTMDGARCTLPDRHPGLHIFPFPALRRRRTDRTDDRPLQFGWALPAARHPAAAARPAVRAAERTADAEEGDVNAEDDHPNSPDPWADAPKKRGFGAETIAERAAQVRWSMAYHSLGTNEAVVSAARVEFQRHHPLRRGLVAASTFLTTMDYNTTDLDSRLSRMTMHAASGLFSASDLSRSCHAPDDGLSQTELFRRHIRADPGCLHVPDHQRTGQWFHPLDESWLRNLEDYNGWEATLDDYFYQRIKARAFSDAAGLISGARRSPQPPGKYITPATYMRCWHASGGICCICKHDIYLGREWWWVGSEDKPPNNKRATMQRKDNQVMHLASNIAPKLICQACNSSTQYNHIFAQHSDEHIDYTVDHTNAAAVAAWRPRM